MIKAIAGSATAFARGPHATATTHMASQRTMVSDTGSSNVEPPLSKSSGSLSGDEGIGKLVMTVLVTNM